MFLLTLSQERETWEEKEREYLQKIDEITENHLRVIEEERVSNIVLRNCMKHAILCCLAI